MAPVNPAGTVFLGLVESLIELVSNPEVSRIEVVIGRYELDGQGNQRLIDGKASVALRWFAVKGMNKEVQEELRREIETGPLSLLMILWTERFEKENKLGLQMFDPVSRQRKPGPAGYDEVERAAISDYLNRQIKADS